MKVNPNNVKKAIIQEAINYKAKTELYKKAKQLNEEVKKLNEMRSFEVGLGPGFKNSTAPGMPGGGGTPAQVLGLATPSPMASEIGDSEDLNAVGNLQDLYALDQEMCCQDGENEGEDAVEMDAQTKLLDLERQIEELKQTLQK